MVPIDVLSVASLPMKPTLVPMEPAPAEEPAPPNPQPPKKSATTTCICATASTDAEGTACRQFFAPYGDCDVPVGYREKWQLT